MPASAAAFGWRRRVRIHGRGVVGATLQAGDPLTQLQYSGEAHGRAARDLCRLAERFAKGRILGLGAGGYNRRNLGAAWSRVVAEFAADL